MSSLGLPMTLMRFCESMILSMAATPGWLRAISETCLKAMPACSLSDAAKITDAPGSAKPGITKCSSDSVDIIAVLPLPLGIQM